MPTSIQAYFSSTVDNSSAKRAERPAREPFRMVAFKASLGDIVVFSRVVGAYICDTSVQENLVALVEQSGGRLWT